MVSEHSFNLNIKYTQDIEMNHFIARYHDLKPTLQNIQHQYYTLGVNISPEEEDIQGFQHRKESPAILLTLGFSTVFTVYQSLIQTVNVCIIIP